MLQVAFRHNNFIIMHSMEHWYLFWGLLKITFNSVIKLTVVLNIKWMLNYGNFNQNVKKVKSAGTNKYTILNNIIYK